MASEITIPRLGWNMEQGVFIGWLRRDGESIRAGDPLFTLEGEKAAQDIEANDSGVLSIDPSSPAAGAVVAVGTVIGHVLSPGESVAPALPVSQGNGLSQMYMDREASAAVSRSPRPGGRQRISPLARRLARELGVDTSRLVGSGSTGRVRKVDVLAAVKSAAPAPGPPSPAAGTSIPISPIRRTIATRMVQSRQTSAPVTLHSSADATNLVNLRAQYKATAQPGRDVPGYQDIIVKLVAMVLRAHPMMSARWDDDRLMVPDEPDIGIAVDAEDGLLVPVIRGAAGLKLGEIVARSRDLIDRARARGLKPDEMQGGTFTITNLGAYGVETFTPIINPPECAILGLGRIVHVPAMVQDRVIGRDRMGLSLTFDHRIVDGAPAARFLQAVVAAIENPGPWLIA